MIRRLRKTDNLLLSSMGSGIFTTLLFLTLNSMDSEAYLRTFFFRAWYIQGLNTFLFGVAIFYILQIFQCLREEKKIAIHIDIRSLTTVCKEKAEEWLERVPSRYKNTMGFRRLSELLRGFINRDEVMRLNEELSRRDVEQFDRGHHFLNSIRSLIPVLGFLGTVLGLSLGMIKFPEHAAQSANIDGLKVVLNDFAASLSLAFDTTLLALAYTIAVVIFSSVLKHREVSFVSGIDEKAREMITKLKRKTTYHIKPAENVEVVFTRLAVNFQEQLKNGIESALETWLIKLESGFSTTIEDLFHDSSQRNGAVGKQIVVAMRQNGDEMMSRLDEIADRFKKPPRYEIIVQPTNGEHHE